MHDVNPLYAELFWVHIMIYVDFQIYVYFESVSDTEMTQIVMLFDGRQMLTIH